MADDHRKALFVLGGQDETSGRVLGDVHRMDLSSSGGVWKRCPSMRWPRMSFGCVVAIVVAGGQSEDSAALGSAEMYDPEKECWEALPNLNTPTSSCVAALTDERIVMLGGAFSSDGEFWVESAQAVGYGDHAWRSIRDEDLPNIVKQCTPSQPPGLLHPLHLNRLESLARRAGELLMTQLGLSEAQADSLSLLGRESIFEHLPFGLG